MNKTIISIFLVFLLCLVTVNATGGVVISPNPAQIGSQLTCSMTGERATDNFYWTGAVSTTGKVVSASVPGTYTCIVKRNYPQIGEVELGRDSVTIQAAPVLNQAPTANFNSNSPVVNGTNATFTDTSTDSDGTVVSWEWNFGDATNSTIQNPQHLYSAIGNYTVTLTVTDDDGATSAPFNSVVEVTSTSTTCPAPASGTWTINGTQNVYCDGVNLTLIRIEVYNTANVVFNNSNLNISWGMDVYDNASMILDNTYLDDIWVDDDATFSLLNTNYPIDVFVGDRATATIQNSTIDEVGTWSESTNITLVDSDVFDLQATIERASSLSNIVDDQLWLGTIGSINLVNTYVYDISLNLGNITSINSSNIDGRILILNDAVISMSDISFSILQILSNSEVHADNTTIDEILFAGENATINFTASTLVSSLRTIVGGPPIAQYMYGSVNILVTPLMVQIDLGNTIERHYPVTVVNQTGPMNGAQVNITDLFGTLLFNGTTDALGYLEAVLTFDNNTQADVYEVYVDGDLLGNIGLLTSTPILYNITSPPPAGSPNITSVSPPNSADIYINVSDSVTFNITAVDPEGSNLTVNWSISPLFVTFNEIITNGSSSNFTYTFNTNGTFLVIVDVTDNESLLDWATWVVQVSLPVMETILINEFEQAGVNGSEWVELYNPNAGPVDISAWEIWEGLSSPGMIHTVPANTTLAADSYYVANFTLTLNNDGEYVTLYDNYAREVDNTSTLADAAPLAYCWARFPNSVDTDTIADWNFQNCTYGITNNIPGVNLPPQITVSSTTPSVVLPINLSTNVAFNVTVVDPEGANMTVNWSVGGLVNQSDLNVLNGSTVEFNYLFVTNGTYLVEATVYDNESATDYTNWTVQVVNGTIPTGTCNPPGSGDWVLNGTDYAYCDGVNLTIGSIQMYDSATLIFNNSTLFIAGDSEIRNNSNLVFDNTTVYVGDDSMVVYGQSTVDVVDSSILGVIFTVFEQATGNITNSIFDMLAIDLDTNTDITNTYSQDIAFFSKSDYNFSGLSDNTILTQTFNNVNLASVNVSRIFLTMMNGSFNIDNSNVSEVQPWNAVINLDNSNVGNLRASSQSVINVTDSTLVNLTLSGSNTINFESSNLLQRLRPLAKNASNSQHIYGDLNISPSVFVGGSLFSNNKWNLTRHYPVYVFDQNGNVTGAEVNITDGLNVLFSDLTINGYIEPSLTFNNETYTNSYEVYVDGELKGAIDLLTSTPIMINVSANAAPIINSTAVNISWHIGDLFSYQVNASDSDVLDTLTFSDDIAEFDINSTTGDINYRPNITLGMISGLITVCDDSGFANNCTSQTFNLGVTNNAPVLFPIGNQIMNEGENLVILLNATDPDGDAITAFMTNDSDSMKNSVFTFVPSLGFSIFNVTTDFNQSGVYTMTFGIMDWYQTNYSMSDTETITITVNNVLLDGTISGFVLNSTGDPINYATVEVKNGTYTIDSTPVGIDGSYSFTIQPGSYDILAYALGHLDNSTSGIVVAENTTTTHNATLETVVTIGDLTGTVRDSMNDLYNSTIELRQSGLLVDSTTTDANGNYSFSNLQIGNYDITVWKEGFNNDLTAGFNLAVGQNTHDVSLTQNDVFAGGVSGTVYNITLFTPIQGATITIYKEGTSEVVQIVNSGSAGTYQVNGLLTTNTYDLNASATGFTTQMFATDVGVSNASVNPFNDAFLS